MIKVNFWEAVADRWTTAIDFDMISKIKKDAEVTAKETIGTNNQELLNTMSIFDEYGDE